MKQIWKGKLKLRIKRECPYYATGVRIREKVLFYHWGWSVSLWTYLDNPQHPEFSDWAKERLRKIFPNCEILDNIVRYNGNVYYPNDYKWIFKYDIIATNNPQVFFDKKYNKYIGYSHRGFASFGIGDTLFDKNIKDISLYYKQPKYRWKYLMTLLKYHLKGNAVMFKDLCEDTIIGHGIMQIVPFKDFGNKQISNMDEAFQAALNFSKYMS